MIKCITPLFICILKCFILFAGVILASLVTRDPGGPSIQFGKNYIKMDASHYRFIVENGYAYDPTRGSDVAFFPIFPKLCTMLVKWLHIQPGTCLLLISNLFMLGTFYLILHMSGYCVSNTIQWALALFVLNPITFFFHVGYAESMFCFFIVLILLGIQQQWPLWLLALLAGVASGIRPVGIAVSASVCWYALTVLNPDNLEGKSWNRFWHLLWIIPISCSGLLFYMFYLWQTFDAPLAFAQTQENWHMGIPRGATIGDKLISLCLLEPIWNVYNPTSMRYWGTLGGNETFLFNLNFWNPLFYLFSWFLIGLGWWKRWLKDYEIFLSLGLLLIPYLTRSYEMSMVSHARFAAVVIPQYFVLGRLFAQLPLALAASLCGAMGLMLGIWTALFLTGSSFF